MSTNASMSTNARSRTTSEGSSGTAPIRFVLAGLGARGAYWLEVLERDERAVIVGLVDPSAEARERAARAHPGVPTYATLAEALENTDADALVLATPPGTRREHVALACRAKLPMLIEKPLALDLAEAAEYVAAASSADVPLMVGLNFRYLHVTKEARRLLDEGVVGEPGFARFTYERWRDGTRPGINKYPLTMEHPMLWEQSVHHLDLMRHLYRREPTRIACRTWNPSWSMYADDTNVAALIEMEGGLIVNYQGTWQSGHVRPSFEWRTDCERGALFQRDQFGDLSWAERDREEPKDVALPPHETWITDTSGVLDAFLRHLLDAEPLECSGADHLRSLAMVEACIRSSRDGKPIAPAELLADLEVSMV